MQREIVVGKYVALLVLLFVTTSESQTAPKRSPTLNNLMNRADVIMAAKILRTDYSRTDGDGPMIATAEVIKCIRGKFSPGDTFDFAETGWWGPKYKKGETRILFLNRRKKRPAPTSDVYVSWHTAYADSLDFFINPDNLPAFSEDRLENFLKETRDLQQTKAKLSVSVQGQTKDSFIILVHLNSPDEEPIWIHRESLRASFLGKKNGRGFYYVLDLSIPGDLRTGQFTEIKSGQVLTLRGEIKREQVEGMDIVSIGFSNRALLFPRRCWSGGQSVQIKLANK